MIYVLIALALIGFLTLTLARQNDQADGQNISDEQAEIYAQELISYVASAQQVIDMMISTGTDIDELDFINPTSAAFNTPPHIHKVFHPQGGGLNYQKEIGKNFSNPGFTAEWFIKKTTNVEWTPTTSPDVMLSSKQMNEAVCKAYNKKVTGKETIPNLSGTMNQWFEDTSTNDLLVSDCATCEGFPTLCVKGSGTSHGIYAILLAQ